MCTDVIRKSCLPEMKGRKALVVSTKNAQQTRYVLECAGVWDCSRKLKVMEGGLVAIPILNSLNEENWKDLHATHSFPVFCENECKIKEVDLPASKKSLLKTPYEKMVDALHNLVRLSTEDFCSSCLPSIPHHWEMHEDLVLLPPESFQNDVWQTYGICVWKTVADSLGCKRVARKHRIEPDGFRSPRVDLLLGDNGWVQHIDNGIKYNYDVTRCMYSCGNIPEKLRVAQFKCVGETVLDLYAGIGYFTLPYLVHAKAEMVHACEWNPAAVEALQRNLIINGVQEKCVIHIGDNKQVCPRGFADRVNLGLIPSSEEGWFVACSALKPTGGILHIHNNVSSLSGDKDDITISQSHAPFVQSGDKDDISQSHAPFVQSGDTECAIKASRENQHDQLMPDTDSTRSRISELFQNDPQNNASNDFESDRCHEDSCSNINTPKNTERVWHLWAQQTSIQILNILESQNDAKWCTEIISVNHVKSYAPHIHHIVLDLECRPSPM